MPELPDVPYQLPALQGRPEWMHADWVDWFRKLKQKIADLTASVTTLSSAGLWTNQAHNAGDFTGNGAMTWTVTSGDLTTLRYTKVGRTLTVNYYIQTTTVGGTPNFSLQMKIPGGYTAATTVLDLMLYNDNATGLAIGLAQATSGSNLIAFQKLTAGNWSASADQTYIFGQLTLETTT